MMVSDVSLGLQSNFFSFAQVLQVFINQQSIFTVNFAVFRRHRPIQAPLWTGTLPPSLPSFGPAQGRRHAVSFPDVSAPRTRSGRPRRYGMDGMDGDSSGSDSNDLLDGFGPRKLYADHHGRGACARLA